MRIEHNPLEQAESKFIACRETWSNLSTSTQSAAIITHTHQSDPGEIPSAPLSVTTDNRVLLSLGESLRQVGWWLDRHGVAEQLVQALNEELALLIDQDRLQPAGIGRDLDFMLADQIRRDRIFWLNRQRPIQSLFLEQMESLRRTLNRELFLGLFEFEGHFAHYPPGGFYKRHRDSFRGAANRVVSMVTYLNTDWQPGDGGELVLYADDEVTEIVTIEPRAGTLVLFLSEEIPHEVRPARRDRVSVAGWFRLNSSINNQIDPPR